MSTVQSAVMTEPGHIELRQFPRPQIAASELLLKVERTGICGSDKHIYAGHMALKFPLVPGHELVGTIVQLGPEAADYLAIVGGPIKDAIAGSTAASIDLCFS